MNLQLDFRVQMQVDDAPQVVRQSVVYCRVCKFPPEYCEFSKTFAECQQDTLQQHPALAATLWPELAAATLETAEPNKDSKDATHGAKAKKQPKKIVTIQTVERTKRKRTTVVMNLEALHLDAKQISKNLGKKYACGATVGSTNGVDEIVVQGDFAHDIAEYLESEYKLLPEQIQVLDPKKK